MPSRRRQADDDIFRIHSRYLGPPGMTLPFAVPYRAIVPGAAAGTGVLMLMAMFGVGAWRFAIAGLAAVAVGALVDRYSGHDRPVSALPAVLGHETGAPRPSEPEPSRAVLRPGQLPVRALPPAGRSKR
jgi:hypothetical protein